VRSYRQTTLLNTLLFRLPLLNPVIPKELPMSYSRRNTIIRSVATITGDVATGVAVASACVWLIETAALGLFLSFLVWLIGALLALALSQFVVHPALTVVLSDSKLDLAVDAVSGLAGRLTRFARSAMQPA
jgi:hypothetical protein